MTDGFTRIANADAAVRDRALVDDLPAAIVACHCQIEIASVQRLAWAWYAHDLGAELVGVPVELSAHGTPVTAPAPAATWADGAPALVAAARAGGAIAVR